MGEPGRVQQGQRIRAAPRPHVAVGVPLAEDRATLAPGPQCAHCGPCCPCPDAAAAGPLVEGETAEQALDGALGWDPVSARVCLVRIILDRARAVRGVSTDVADAWRGVSCQQRGAARVRICPEVHYGGTLLCWLLCWCFAGSWDLCRRCRRAACCAATVHVVAAAMAVVHIALHAWLRSLQCV